MYDVQSIAVSTASAGLIACIPWMLFSLSDRFNPKGGLATFANDKDRRAFAKEHARDLGNFLFCMLFYSCLFAYGYALFFGYIDALNFATIPDLVSQDPKRFFMMWVFFDMHCGLLSAYVLYKYSYGKVNPARVQALRRLACTGIGTSRMRGLFPSGKFGQTAYVFLYFILSLGLLNHYSFFLGNTIVHSDFFSLERSIYHRDDIERFVVVIGTGPKGKFSNFILVFNDGNRISTEGMGYTYIGPVRKGIMSINSIADHLGMQPVVIPEMTYNIRMGGPGWDEELNALLLKYGHEPLSWLRPAANGEGVSGSEREGA